MTSSGYTKIPEDDPSALSQMLTGAGHALQGQLRDPASTVLLSDLRQRSCFGGSLEDLRGRSVLLAARDQLPTALAMIELDGIARRIVLVPPDLRAEHLAPVVEAADVDAVVRDATAPAPRALDALPCVRIGSAPARAAVDRAATEETEWILLTSGTTSGPKLVHHTFSSLTGALRRPRTYQGGTSWSTFYDIRRYGGLQILLRAVLAGGSLVLSSPNEPLHEFLDRAGRSGVTHITGTPSHWRSVLMSGAVRAISPQYLRLSGEIADQALLDALRSAYPEAKVVHAFASTEAGVAFDVEDGLAGFPAKLVGPPCAGVEIRVEQGTLCIRSRRTARCYLGRDVEALADGEGFVDTGDLVELRGDRYHFVGRRNGVINVGGLKVHPEEVESVINAHPWVRMSLVRARRSPITGAVVVADVVLAPIPGGAVAIETVEREIADTCRRALPAHKVPATIRTVSTLEVSASGKLVRPRA